MPVLEGRACERQGILEIANLMAVAARTAPKAGGKDDILTAVVTGTEGDAIAADMVELAAERSNPAWIQQAGIIKASRCHRCHRGAGDEELRAQLRRLRVRILR